MSEWTTNAALVIFIIITVGDKVLGFLKTRGIDLQKMSKQTNELYDWHNHEDPDQPGVKIWWNQKYISQLIHKLSELQTTQTALLREVHRDSKANVVLQQEMIILMKNMITNQECLIKVSQD